MADLGDIQYQNETAGTRIVDRTLESRGIAQGLVVAEKAYNEGVLANETSKMMTVIEDQAAMSAGQLAQRTDEVVPGSTEDFLTKRLATLQNTVAQNSGSAKTSAMMRIQGVLSDAKVNHPHLYEKLQARAGAVVAGSESMTQLGLDDQTRSARARGAQAQYDAIMGNATTAWDKGGLGIPVDLHFADPEFQRLYKERSQLRNDLTEAEITVAMAMANTRAHAIHAMPQLQEALLGERGALPLQLRGLEQKYDLAGVLDMQGRQDSEALRFMEDWATDGGFKYTSELRAMRDKYKLEWARFDVTLKNSPEGEQLGKSLQVYTDIIDAQIKAIEDLANGLPGAEDRIRSNRALMQNSQFLSLDDNQQSFLAWQSSDMGQTMIEVMSMGTSPDAQSLVEYMGLVGNTVFGGMYPEHFDPTHPDYDATNRINMWKSTGALNLPPDATAPQILSSINDVFLDPNGTFVVPASNNQEQTLAALHQEKLHLDMWKRAATIPNGASSRFADETLLGLTYSMEFLNGTEAEPANVTEEGLNYLADGSLAAAVDASLEGGKSGRRSAFASTAGAFYVSSRPGRRKEEIKQQFAREPLARSSVTLAEVVSINYDALVKDQFQYKIDNAGLQTIASSLADQGSRNRFISTGSLTAEEADRQNERYLGEARQLVETKMATIQEEMQRQISIERLLNKARSVDGVNFARKDDWSTFFLGAEGADGQNKTAWVNVFGGSYHAQ